QQNGRVLARRVGEGFEFGAGGAGFTLGLRRVVLAQGHLGQGEAAFGTVELFAQLRADLESLLELGASLGGFPLSELEGSQAGQSRGDLAARSPPAGDPQRLLEAPAGGGTVAQVQLYE